MLVAGKQSTNEVTPLLVDSLGRVLVTASEPTALNPTGIITQYSNLNIGAGLTQQVIYTVPAGQRMKATYFFIRYAGTVATVTLYPIFVQGSNSLIIAQINVPMNGFYYTYAVDILLEAGDSFVCNIINGTAGDDFYSAIALQRYK